MSDQRRFIRASGRLPSSPISDFWQPSRTAQDPPIPNLPLETAAAQGTWEQGTQPAKAFKRVSTERRLLQAPVHPTTVTIEAGTDTALADPFQTRVGRSRRSLAMGWMAALTTAATPAVFPYASVIGARSIRRRETSRQLVTVEPLHWPYIAPTVAAILKPERAKVIEFRTRLQVEPVLILATPPTGPPSEDSALHDPFVTRVKHRRKRPTIPDVIGVNAATPPAFPVSAVFGFGIKRRHSRAGLFLSAGDILSVPSTATTPAVYPSFLARELPPFEFAVRHQREPIQPDFPETPVTASDNGTLADPFVTRVHKRRKRPVQAEVIGVGPAAPSEAPISALILHKAKGRKRRPGLFLSAGDILSVPPTVPEQPPSAWKAQPQFKHESRYTLIAAAPQIVYPETPVAPEPERPVGGHYWPTGKKHRAYRKEHDEDRKRLRELIDQAIAGEQPSDIREAATALVKADTETVASVPKAALIDFVAVAKEIALTKQRIASIEKQVQNALRLARARQDDEQLIELLIRSGLLD